MLYKFDQAVCTCSPFFPRSPEKNSELSWLVMKPWCAQFFPNISGGLVERWLLWNRFEFVDVILVWVRSSCILQVLDRRWKMPKPQVPDVRCKVKGCWCVAVFHDVCGQIPSRLVISRYQTTYPGSSNFRSMKDIFFGFIILEKFPCGKPTTLL